MAEMLQTKKKSATPSQSRQGSAPHVTGKGNKITFKGKHIDGQVKIKPRHKNGYQALAEIRKYQKTYDLLIPKLPFHRLVREITQNIAGDKAIRYQTAALEAIQEATESFLVRMFEDAYMCTTHAKRVTLFPSDIILCRRLQNNFR